MPITKAIQVKHVLMGLQGDLKSGSATVTFERFEDEVSVRNDIVFALPAEDFVPMLQEPIPAEKVGYPLGYYLADQIMAWAIDKGYLSGEIE